jgi:hypothetical protein
MDWVAEGLEGSLRAGKSKGGRKGVMLNLALPERSVYQLQRMLEEMAAPNGDFFKTRAAVLLSEDLRMAVVVSEEVEANREAFVKLRAHNGGHPQGE